MKVTGKTWWGLNGHRSVWTVYGQPGDVTHSVTCWQWIEGEGP